MWGSAYIHVGVQLYVYDRPPNLTQLEAWLFSLLVMMLTIIDSGRDFFKVGQIWDNKSSSVSLNAKMFSLSIFT